MAYNQRQRNGAPRQDYYGHQDPQYDSAYANEYANGGSQQDHGYNTGYANDYGNSAARSHLGPNKPQKPLPMYNYDSWGGNSTGPKQRNHYDDPRNQNVQSFDPRVQDRSVDRGPTNGYQNEGHGNNFAFQQTNGSDRGHYSQRNEPYDSRSQGHPGALYQPHEENQMNSAESRPDNDHYGNPYGNEQHRQNYDQQNHGQRHERDHLPRSSPEKSFNKSNHQRGLDESKSPQKLSWDNPFPAFPGKSKKSSLEEDENRPDYQQNSNTEIGHGVEKPRPIYGELSGPATDGRGSLDDGRSYGQTDGRPQQRPKISRSAHSETVQGHDRPVELSAREGHGTGNDATTMALPYRYDRSQTMPAAVSHELQSPPQHANRADWQEPGAVSGYYGPEDKGFLPNGSPHTPGRQPRMKPRANSGERRRHEGTDFQPQYPPGNPYINEDHSRDQVNANYNSTQQSYPASQFDDRPDQNGHGHLGDEEMPNFEVLQNGDASHSRGRTIDEHLRPQRAREPLPPLPPQTMDRNHTSRPGPPYGGDPVPRSKSQPDFQARRSPHPYNDPRPGPNLNGYPDRRPATSSSNERPGPYGRPLPGPPRGGRLERPLPRGPNQQGAEQGRWPPPGDRNGPLRGQGAPHDRRSPGPHQGRPGQHGRTSDDRVRRTGPSPPNRTGTVPPPPPPHANVNPDALPHHPAPVRPGLMGSPPASQNGKPTPVRRYDETPSPMSPPAGPPDAGSLPQRNNKRESQPVTYHELDRLRQRVNSNPDDQATRLLLAKKLVEASTVLIDERADQRTRAKAREDYITQALKIVKKLAGSNYPDGMFYLGDCYSRGSLGLATDPKEAFTLYQSAAKANHAQAAYRVAVCCEMGLDEGGGTRKDPVKAMQWYKRAATLGDTSGMYKMGIIQLKGLLGQPKNVKDALVWLKQAADRADEENPHALHELALLYDKPSGMDGVPKDEAQAKRLFTQAAKLGYKFSQFRLGSAYEYGLLGCPVDPRQSIAWYSKAAVQEEHQSELALSGWYLTGSDGVLQQSDTEAYLWARKAAQAGLAKAEYAMGYFTEVGIGAPSNLEDAKRWYWRAASQNFPKARERLEDLRKGSPIKQKARVSRSNMKKQSDGECSIM